MKYLENFKFAQWNEVLNQRISYFRMVNLQVLLSYLIEVGKRTGDGELNPKTI